MSMMIVSGILSSTSARQRDQGSGPGTGAEISRDIPRSLVPAPDSLDAGIWLARWEASSRRTASPQQRRRNTNILLRFFRFAVEPPGCLRPAAVEAHLAAMADAGDLPKTQENHLIAVKAFSRWLADQEEESGLGSREPGLGSQEPGLGSREPCSFPRGDPLRKLRPAKAEETIPNFLSEDEVSTCLHIARSVGIYAEVVVALYAGLRMGELRLIAWQDVNFETGSIIVPKTKSKHPRSLPLHPLASAALIEQRYITGRWHFVFPGGNERKDGACGLGQWNRNRPRRPNTWCNLIAPLAAAMPAFRRGCKRGVGRGWHLLRHTWASRLAQAGLSEYKLMQWGGWSSSAMVRRYAHLRPAYDPQIELLK